MNIKLGLVAIAFFSFASAGCAGIRVVKRTPVGGELALVGAREEAQQKANEYMARQCPGGYDVVEEGEAVVGQKTSTTASKTRGLFGEKQMQSDSVSEDKREWRVKYQCKRDAPEAPAAAPAAPAAAPLKTGRSDAVREVVVTFLARAASAGAGCARLKVRVGRSFPPCQTGGRGAPSRDGVRESPGGPHGGRRARRGRGL